MEITNPFTQKDSPHILTSYAEQFSAVETFKKSTEVLQNRLHLMSASVVEPQATVDVSWLPAASEKYHLSSDIKDYILAEVPIVEGDVPNRNMNCFLTSRLLDFQPTLGMPTFRTFVGKPVFYEHQHHDITKAKGVILDSRMTHHAGRWFVTLLKAFDRTKDRSLAESVLSGKRRGHSMSAWAGTFECSICAHKWDTTYAKSCDCVRGPVESRMVDRYLGKGLIMNGSLCYDVPGAFHFFESSSVGDPANYAAHQLQQTSVG